MAIMENYFRLGSLNIVTEGRIYENWVWSKYNKKNF